jgi:hypothetical protein
MSITVRYWTKNELEALNAIQSNIDFQQTSKEYQQLLTIFINKKTSNENEIQVYRDMPVTLKNNYVASIPDLVEFKAPNDDLAKWFISQEYIGNWPIHEVTTHYRKI